MKEKIISFSILLLLTVFVVVVLALTIRGVSGNPTPAEILTDLDSSEGKPFELSPERGRYALTQSVVENRSLSFSREIAEYVVPDLGYWDGKFVSLFAPGVSFIAVPFYLFGRAFGSAQLGAFSLSGVFALFNVLLISVIVKRLTKNRFAGVAAGLTFLFATVAWPYAVTLYQHHVTTFLLLLSFYILTFKTNFATAFLVSFIFGISIFVGYPNAIFFVPILILMLAKHISTKEAGSKLSVAIKLSVLLGAVGLVISLVPIFLYNYHVFGEPFQLRGAVQRIKEIGIDFDTNKVIVPVSVAPANPFSYFKPERLPNGLDVLLTSKDRGLIWFSPVILLGLLGIYPLYKRNREIAYTLLGGILAILLLYGMWGDPWGGWSFGPRYLIPAMAMTAILLGVAISVYGRKVWFSLPYMAALIYSLGISLAGALTTNRIPPSVEVDIARYPLPTFLHNFNLINQGKSGSFVYNTYLDNIVALDVFTFLIFGTVLAVIMSNYFLSIFSSKERKKT